MKIMRSSNMELMRIVAILLVMIFHACFYSAGVPTRMDATSHPFSTYAYIAVEQLSAVCVNLFVLVSGFFMIRPKIKSILNLLFIWFFWVSAKVIFMGVPAQFSVFNPFESWFVGSYFGLVLISPLLNAFIENSDEIHYRKYLSVIVLLQVVLDLVVPVWGIFKGGYSVCSFAILYLIVQYIRRFSPRIIQFRKSYFLGCYMVVSLLSACIVFLAIYLVPEGNPLCQTIVFRIRHGMMTYSSPVVVLASVSLFVFFVKLDFSSVWVNHVARSCFAVFIAHQFPLYFDTVRRFYAEKWSPLWILCLVATLFVMIVVLDQVRILMWNFSSRLMNIALKRK